MKLNRISLFLLSTHLIFALIFASCGVHADSSGFQLDPSDEQQLIRDLRYLSSDKLEGRKTGTEGSRLAINFIEQRFAIVRASGVSENSPPVWVMNCNERS